jgi:hypothetical protein
MTFFFYLLGSVDRVAVYVNKVSGIDSSRVFR